MCRHAYRLTRDTAVAEDLVQELFTKLWNQREELDIQTSIRQYLFRATTNAALNHLQKAKRFVQEEAGPPDTPDTSPGSDSLVRENQVKAALEKALADLPPRCRTIFILNRYEGMNYQQIATQLNISFHTVKNQMTIALSRLREHLQEFIQK